MESFIRFYDGIYRNHGFNLEIYHSSIMDWTIKVGYKATHPKHGEEIISIQSCDIDLAFAKAQVELKEWLSENKGGY